MNGGEKLANYQPTDFRFSPDDRYLTYLHAASHQVRPSVSECRLLCCMCTRGAYPILNLQSRQLIKSPLCPHPPPYNTQPAFTPADCAAAVGRGPLSGLQTRPAPGELI